MPLSSYKHRQVRDSPIPIFKFVYFLFWCFNLKSLSFEFSSIGGLESIDIAKGFEALDGDLLVNPRYDVKSSIFDVVLGYSKDKTAIKLEATTSDQKLTVSRQVTDSDKLSPSVSSSGDISLAWEKSLSGGDTVTTTLKTNDSVNVKWEDGAWTAQISTPIDGFELGEGVDVSIKRKVNFM